MSGNFWNVVGWMAYTFFFIAYLMVLFQILADLFRDHSLGGGKKAAWIIGLIFLPLLTALVYVIARGRGMAERQRVASESVRSDTEAYIRQVAGAPSASDQIASAKRLLDSGTITQDEFARLKSLALVKGEAQRSPGATHLI